MNFPFFPAAVVKITGILYDSLTLSLKQPPNVMLKTCRHVSVVCAHPHLSELGLLQFLPTLFAPEALDQVNLGCTNKHFNSGHQRAPIFLPSK